MINYNKQKILFKLINLFLNLLSTKLGYNIETDQTIDNNIENKLTVSNLPDEILVSILDLELRDYIDQIKKSNDIFEFYKLLDEEKYIQLKNIRLTNKLFNKTILRYYIPIISNKFKELKAKLIEEYKNESRKDLDKKLKNILIKKGFFKTTKLKKCCELIIAGADINLKAGDNFPILVIASGRGSIEMVRLLLDENVDINLQDRYGFTALMLAASMGHTEIVKLLLDKSVDVNLKDDIGSTALMLASYKGYIEIVKLLIDKNADIKVKNNIGFTALTLAAGRGHTEIVKLLIDKNAELENLYNKFFSYFFKNIL